MMQCNQSLWIHTLQSKSLLAQRNTVVNNKTIPDRQLSSSVGLTF